jgi:hypothetical protein
VDAEAARKPGGRPGTAVALTPLTKQVIGANVTAHDERNGYWFWGLVAAFIGIPELLAAAMVIYLMTAANTKGTTGRDRMECPAPRYVSWRGLPSRWARR